MARYVPDRRFTQAVERDAAYRATLHGVAEARVASAARANLAQAQGPWMPRPGEQITTESDSDGVHVVNNDHASSIQEFGSINSPPWAILRRAARQAGLKLREE